MSAEAAVPKPQDAAFRIAVVVSVLVFTGLLCFFPVTANDIWLQIKIGQMILADGSIPQTVLFPFTWARNNPFHMHEWLPSILFYLIDAGAGRTGLMLLQGGLGLVLLGVCVRFAWQQSGSLAIAVFLASVALLVLNFRYEMRPELFALVFLVLFLQCLATYTKDKNKWLLVWLLPLELVWANTHGSFLLGPVVSGIFAVGEAAEAFRHSAALPLGQRMRAGLRAGWPYAVLVLALVAISLANPMGPELWVFALNLKGSAVTHRFINEWLPTLGTFTGEPAFYIFLCALLGYLAVMLAMWRSLSVTDGLLMAAFTYLAFQHVRFVGLIGFVGLAVCSRLLGLWPQRERHERWLLRGTTLLLALGVGLMLKFGNVFGAYPYASASTNFTEPMQAQLANPQVRGNVLNTYDLGAELVYRAYPRLRPMIDPRIDSYGDGYFLLYERLLSNETLLNAFIADFDVRYMLLLWSDFARVKGMPSIQSHWKLRFGDQKMVLLERMGAALHVPAAGVSPVEPGVSPPSKPAVAQ